MSPKESAFAQALLLAGWLLVIAFSSTGIAATWADQFYRYLFGSLESSRPGIVHLVAQKAYHVFLFAVLGWILASFTTLTEKRLSRGVLWAFGIGALSESVQLFFPSRNPHFADFLLNGVSGSIAFRLVVARR